MRRVKIPKGGLLILACLALVIAALAVSLSYGLRQREPLEITTAPAETFNRQVYVGGAVANPGYYPATDNDSLADLIAAAGGLTGYASELSISVAAGSDATQRVDINRAADWLLRALPGIGEVRAQAIIDYREAHGPFQNTRQLLDVPGISQGIYDGLREYVTAGGA